MADNYKHENGKATIFKNKYKDTESKPDFKKGNLIFLE